MKKPTKITMIAKTIFRPSVVSQLRREGKKFSQFIVKAFFL
jgi:hypothetical protein